MSVEPSKDPEQWFEEDDDGSEDGDFVPPPEKVDDDAASSSGELSEEEDGDETDPECEVSPLDLAKLVCEVSSLPPGKREAPLSGKMYKLSPPGQAKKPMVPIFSKDMPSECDQLCELFYNGGKRYYRPVIDGTTVRFNVVTVKTIRSVLKEILDKLPENERDIRVFCQEHTTEAVFKHLLGIEEPKAKEPEKEEAAAAAAEPAKKKPALKRKPQQQQPSNKRAKVQQTLDAAIVVRDSPNPPPIEPQPQVQQPQPRPQVQPTAVPITPQPAQRASTQAVAQIIRAKMAEIDTLLGFLEQQSATDAVVLGHGF